MTAGAVIVTYNSAGAIGPCLDSCRHLPTVVIDNASTDATAVEVLARPWVRFIQNPTNAGFAAAVNQGVEQTGNPLILLLNPDVELLTPIDPLMEACQEPGTAIAAGQLVDASGQPQRGFTLRRLPTPAALAFEVLGLNRLVPRNPVNRRYRCLDLDLSQPADVEQPAGAFLLFRRDLWQHLGGFDPAFYPIWFEDVDFCQRAIASGHRIRYVPQVIGTHQGGHSLGTLGWPYRQRYWYASLLRYAFKHFPPRAFRGVSVAVVLGSVFRALEALVFARVQARREEIWRTYARVIRLAAGCAVRGNFPEPSEYSDWPPAVD